MAVRAFEVTELAMFVLAILAILVGTAVNGRVAALRASGIPPAVTGGLLFAALAWIARSWPGIELAWPGTIRALLLLVFFSGLGLSAKFAGLKQGGAQVALLCVAIALTIVMQNAVGIAIARAFQQPAALGLFVGSIPFLGGHGTAAAWAQSADASTIPAAFELGIAAATLGLIVGGIVSGPVATRLARHARSSPATEADAPRDAREADEGRSLGDLLSSDRWLKALLLIAAALAIGEVLQHLMRSWSLNLPAFLTAMFGGILITNLADVVRRPVDHALAELVSTIALRLFLAMSMLSLKLWELIPFAGLFAAVIVAQVALIVALASFVLFPMLGRDRDAAIASGGFIGFAMGAMPVGLGTMRRLAETLGPAPRAFLIITLAASLFTDTANAVAIQAFFDWLD